VGSRGGGCRDDNNAGDVLTETRWHALSASYMLLLPIIALGAYLRFSQLDNPVWIDEVLPHTWEREQLPYIFSLFLPPGDFWLRLPSALFGTLTIWAVFEAIEDKGIALGAALFVAVFPLFVFWSTLARPYSIAGFFVAIGWRWRAGYILALLCTPLAILGFHFNDWKWIAVGLVICIGLFLIRPDTDRSFLDYNFLTNARRIYVPFCVGLVLHLGMYSARIGRFISED